MSRRLVLIVCLGLLGCALMGSGSPTVTGAQAQELVQKQQALLLDVRSPEEFAEGHLEKAVNIPVQQLESKLSTLADKKDQPIVVYCRSGRRSANAKTMLEKAGFTKVADLGAMSNWK